MRFHRHRDGRPTARARLRTAPLVSLHPHRARGRQVAEERSVDHPGTARARRHLGAAAGTGTGMTGKWVLAADTLVRFRDGRILVHTASSPLPACQSEDPMLIGWLCHFARPADPVALAATLQAAERQAG